MVTVPEVAGGRVRWLAGRAIDPGRSPRFQAPPGPKPVLGLGRLGPAPPWAVVAEGVFDWLLLSEWGLPACAALGTQGMERVAAALRGCPRVFLAFDHDDAGREATAALGSLLGRRAAAVTLPEGVADVAELATHHEGRRVFLRLLERAATRRPLTHPSHPAGTGQPGSQEPGRVRVPAGPTAHRRGGAMTHDRRGSAPRTGLPAGRPAPVHPGTMHTKEKTHGRDAPPSMADRQRQRAPTARTPSRPSPSTT